MRSMSATRSPSGWASLWVTSPDGPRCSPISCTSSRDRHALIAGDVDRARSAERECGLEHVDGVPTWIGLMLSPGLPSTVTGSPRVTLSISVGISMRVWPGPVDEEEPEDDDREEVRVRLGEELGRALGAEVDTSSGADRRRSRIGWCPVPVHPARRRQHERAGTRAAGVLEHRRGDATLTANTSLAPSGEVAVVLGLGEMDDRVDAIRERGRVERTEVLLDPAREAGDAARAATAARSRTARAAPRGGRPAAARRTRSRP